jgi:hypothetical protein
MATLAVFIALGGTGYAVSQIGSGQIKNNSVRSKDVRNNTLRGKDIRDSSITGKDILESSLGAVPSAQQASDATRVGGLTATDLKVRCPAGTALSAAGCIELQPRGAAVYGNAISACAFDNRRLPSHAELLGVFRSRPAGLGGLAPGGELTSSVYGDPPLKVLVMTSDTGDVAVVGTPAGNERQFRCLVNPSN